MSFDDKKKADSVIINAIMNLMTTRQRDDEESTECTKHFKVARDLCKETYRGTLKIPMLTQNESTWGSDEETSFNTVHVSFLSVLYLKNMDQAKYGSFIKKMAEDLPQVGRTSTQSILRMRSMFCPSTSTIKLTMISTRSHEMIATKIACPQRTKTVQPPECT